MQRCKPKEEEQEPSTGIVLTVKGDIGGGSTTNLAGADVYLFRSEQDYQDFMNNVSANYVEKAQTDGEGRYTFCDLEADSVEYFFYAQFDNMNNSGANSQYRMGGPLYENAAHYVTITLNGFVTKKIHIYSEDQTIQGNKIYIYLSEGGNLNESNRYTLAEVGSSSATSSDDRNYILYAPANGTYKYYIKNDFGCVWTEIIDVVDDTPIEIKLANCNDQSFTFYSSGLSGGSIKIYLNNENQEIGTLNSVGSATTNQLTVYRPSGSYTYRAEHSNGTCTWIEETDGTPVDLSGCD